MRIYRHGSHVLERGALIVREKPDPELDPDAELECESPRIAPGWSFPAIQRLLCLTQESMQRSCAIEAALTP